MLEAAEAAAARLNQRDGDVVEIEEQTSHAAADVIFHTLFSIRIKHKIARDVFDEIRVYQRSQPTLNIAAFLPLLKWM
jgi:phosphoribosyl-ATP pyrophosphohydrolase